LELILTISKEKTFWLVEDKQFLITGLGHTFSEALRDFGLHLGYQFGEDFEKNMKQMDNTYIVPTTTG